MKNEMQIIGLFFVCFLLFTDCKINKEAEGNVNDEVASSADCSNSQKAIVLDYTGLSGCRYLLETTDGTVLNPLKISDEKFTKESLSGISELKISYSVINGAMTNCMKGKNVDITCLEIIKEGEPKKGVF